MNRLLKSTCVLVFAIAATACSSTATRDILGNAAANAADSRVGYSSQQCFKVKSECVQGHYQEWNTSDGTPGCSCKKL